MRTRRLRAGLSALGIAIGVAAIVAVLGLSASSQAGLLAEIDRLGTNLLTVTTGQTLFGDTAELPLAAPGMIARIGPVTQVADTGSTSASVYRSPLIPVRTDRTRSASRRRRSTLLPVVGATVTRGAYLNAATERRAGRGARRRGRAAARHRPHLPPASASGWAGSGSTSPASSARRCSRPRSTAPCSSASPPPRPTSASTVTRPRSTSAARPARSPPSRPCSPRPPTPKRPTRSTSASPRPSLTARADAQGALNGLFLGLGAVSLLVGAVGVANIMLISVLERRSEIGLRRALGATKGHIRTQFLSEAILLALLGGAVGVTLGVLATAIYAHTKHWTTVIPTLAWAGGLAAAIAIGAIAGLLPAIRAARLSPTDALRTL